MNDTGTDQRKDQFFTLAERGRLLPAVEDIDTDDDAELAEIKTILAEMVKTKAEMDALLDESLAKPGWLECRLPN